MRIEANDQKTAYDPNRSSRRKLQKRMSTPRSFERQKTKTKIKMVIMTLRTWITSWRL